MPKSNQMNRSPIILLLDLMIFQNYLRVSKALSNVLPQNTLEILERTPLQTMRVDKRQDLVPMSHYK